MIAPQPATEPWLSVLGIGDDGLCSLSPEARALLDSADLLVGGERHLAMVPDHPARRLRWRRPIESTLDALEGERGHRVVVLASGDPMCFGIGELLSRRFGPREMRVVPAPSAFSLVCARLFWSRQEVETLSVHGRAPAVLHRHLYPGARLIVLGNDGDTPAEIARMLTAKGYGPSRLWVFEHLGSEREREVHARAEAWEAPRCAALNTVAIECRPGPEAAILSRVPGLPDDAFGSDGMLTKREVRAATLAGLAPLPGQCLWDVGAGSGAIAIEWLRAAGRARAFAIERDPARCRLIKDNATNLGTPELRIVEGEAPECLIGLEAPDAVFIGGGASRTGLVEHCWQELRPGGRLVANVVTIEGERALLEWHQRFGGEFVRIAVAHTQPVGPYSGWRPLMPVTQLVRRKS